MRKFKILTGEGYPKSHVDIQFPVFVEGYIGMTDVLLVDGAELLRVGCKFFLPKLKYPFFKDEYRAVVSMVNK